MGRVMQLLLAGVPMCDRTDRAIAATLADWRHEAGRADSAAARVLVAGRSVVGVCRALSGSALRQLPGEARSPFLWRVLIGTVLGTCGIAYLFSLGLRPGTILAHPLLVSLSFAASMILIALPVFVFMAESTGRSARRGPSLASGLVLAVLLLLFVFLLVPEVGNYHYSQFGRSAPGDLPPIPSPLRLLSGEPTLPLSFMFMVTRGLNWLSLTFLVCGTAVLAYRVRLSAADSRLPAFVPVTGAILAVAVVPFGLALVFSALWSLHGIRLGPFTQQLIPLSLAASAFVAAGWLARRTTRQGGVCDGVGCRQGRQVWVEDGRE